MYVRDIMQPEVYCATHEMTVADLYTDLTANEITGAPVLDDKDYLVGVVSLTDIARCLAGKPKAADCAYYNHNDHREEIQADDIQAGLLVKDIMSPHIHQVYHESTVEEALDLMLDEDIHRVVVTHRGHVIGIVTSGDMMREFREMLRSED